MIAITKTASVAVLVILGLSLAALTAEPPKVEPVKPEPRKGSDAVGAAEKTLTIDLGNDLKMEFVLIPAGDFEMLDAQIAGVGSSHNDPMNDDCTGLA